MLAKLTSKNQLTLPKAVIEQVPQAQYFDVRAEGGQIVLTPVRITSAGNDEEALKPIWRKIEKLGITENDIDNAVKSVRRKA
ncbi:MAG: AbrB/MazE/SpoVT family DNA-binding domain-containing protein [Burkholderiales bacterium]